jgi:hypothetical protein
MEESAKTTLFTNPAVAGILVIDQEVSVAGSVVVVEEGAALKDRRMARTLLIATESLKEGEIELASKRKQLYDDTPGFQRRSLCES